MIPNKCALAQRARREREKVEKGITAPESLDRQDREIASQVPATVIAVAVAVATNVTVHGQTDHHGLLQTTASGLTPPQTSTSPLSLAPPPTTLIEMRPNKCSLAQRARRERERVEKGINVPKSFDRQDREITSQVPATVVAVAAASNVPVPGQTDRHGLLQTIASSLTPPQTSTSPLSLAPPPATLIEIRSNKRTLAQRARRERERVGQGISVPKSFDRLMAQRLRRDRQTASWVTATVAAAATNFTVHDQTGHNVIHQTDASGLPPPQTLTSQCLRRGREINQEETNPPPKRPRPLSSIGSSSWAINTTEQPPLLYSVGSSSSSNNLDSITSLLQSSAQRRSAFRLWELPGIITKKTFQGCNP